MAAKHQLEELSDRLSILPNLLLRPLIQDCQTCIDVPLVGVNAQHNVAFDVLNTTNIPIHLPGKLVVRMPGRAHT